MPIKKCKHCGTPMGSTNPYETYWKDQGGYCYICRMENRKIRSLNIKYECRHCGKPMSKNWYEETKNFCKRCKEEHGGLRGLTVGIFTNGFRKLFRRPPTSLLERLEELEKNELKV